MLHRATLIIIGACQRLKLGYLCISFYDICHQRIIHCCSLDLSEAGRVVTIDIVHLVRFRIATHNRVNHLLLIADFIPHISVKRSLCYVGEDFNLRVFVSGAQDTSFSLLNISRLPRAVKMVQRNQMVLEICSCAHHLG